MEKKKKQYKSLRIIKLHFFKGVPLKGYVASSVIFRFGARDRKKKSVTNDA